MKIIISAVLLALFISGNAYAVKVSEILEYGKEVNQDSRGLSYHIYKGKLYVCGFLKGDEGWENIARCEEKELHQQLKTLKEK